MYKISYKEGYIVQHREYSQYFIVTKWSLTFKNCESLYCRAATYLILYNNSTWKKMKGLWNVFMMDVSISWELREALCSLFMEKPHVSEDRH